MKPSLMSAALLAASLALSSASAADSPVVARVNSATITEAQVTELTDRIASVREGGGPGGATAPSGRDEIVGTLIDLELLSQAAKAEKIEAPPAEVDRQLNTLKAQFENPEAFQAALARNHMNEAELRQDIVRQIRMQRLLDKHISVKVGPDAVEQYYKDHPDRFQRPPEVRASHILFRVPPGGDATAVRPRAEATLKRIKQGEDFAAVAKELSEDPESIQNNGDLGFFAREAVPKPLGDTAFGLNPGEVSDVIESSFGLHILKVTDARDAGLMPLADVKPQLQQFLEDQERAKQGQAYVDGLKKKAKISIVEPAKKP